MATSYICLGARSTPYEPREHHPDYLSPPLPVFSPYSSGTLHEFTAQVAAVIGETFSFDILEKVLSLDIDEATLQKHLNVLVESNFLLSWNDLSTCKLWFRFTHSMVSPVEPYELLTAHVLDTPQFDNYADYRAGARII